MENKKKNSDGGGTVGTVICVIVLLLIICNFDAIITWGGVLILVVIAGILVTSIVRSHRESVALRKKEEEERKRQRELDIAIKSREAERKIEERKKAIQNGAKAYQYSINTELQNAERSKRIGAFIQYYDGAVEKLEELAETIDAELLNALYEINFYPNPKLREVKDEFQWHLCDAIERAKLSTLEEIRTKYRNSVEFQKKRAHDFYNEIETYKNRFSDGSLKFANEAALELFRFVKEPAPTEIVAQIDNRGNFIPDKSAVTAIENVLSEVDYMEGHDFERWCADLLEVNEFNNVEVTRGSGDQGVDVVAEKGGVWYAIQCKCYTSDLGNKPVQEVFAGKEFYGCQVGVVMTNRGFTAGATQLAEKTKVLLWGREKLVEMIKYGQRYEEEKERFEHSSESKNDPLDDAFNLDWLEI